MKSVTLIALLVTSSAAFAKGQVFCKEEGKIINVLSRDGFSCQGALYDGSVCFTGNAGEAAVILNSSAIRDLFDGTDGEYIKNAKAKDADTITYTQMDEANGWSDKISIKRCLGSWFRN